MAGQGPVGHSAADADRVVLRGPGVYYGGLLLATAGGASTVDVYDGIDAGGELIDSLHAAASGVDKSWMDRGIELRRGLFVDAGSYVSACTLYYDVPTPTQG